jgi:DsbE subfamily thiol:disulfide oxidoreductase
VSKRILVAGVVMFFVIMAGMYITREKEQQGISYAEPQKTETGVTIGKTAPAFTLSSLDGKTIEVGREKRPYVLNFWATWCPPCRAEIPELDEFARKYNGKIEFYAINLQESDEKVLNFLKPNNYNLPVLLDNSGTVAQTFRVTAIPTTIVVDAQGTICYRKTGGVTLSELEGIINGL